MLPVKLEIIAYAPTIFTHCAHCELVWDGVGIGQRLHQEQWDNSFPDDLREEYMKIADMAARLQRKYGPWLRVTLVDAASVEGFLKSLRYRVRHFPAFVVNGRDKVIGLEEERVAELIDRCLSGAVERR